MAGRKNEIRDLRRDMIQDTNRFLTWALQQEREMPRIPIRRVEKGGFDRLMSIPGASKLAGRWWGRTLDLIRKD